MKRQKWTARRSLEALRVELLARRADAAAEVKRAYSTLLMRPGYVDKNTRDFVERLIAEVAG